MIKNLTPIGNSEGIILDRTLLGLLERAPVASMAKCQVVNFAEA